MVLGGCLCSGSELSSGSMIASSVLNLTSRTYTSLPAITDDGGGWGGREERERGEGWEVGLSILTRTTAVNMRALSQQGL